MKLNRPLLTLLCCLLGAAGSAQQSGPGGLTRYSRSLEELSARVGPAVVQIFATRYRPRVLGASSAALIPHERVSGSGVLVSENGYVVTNAHVVANARRIQVLLATAGESTLQKSILRPRGKRIGAQIVGLDLETDLAVLKIEGSNLPFLTFGDSDRLRQGQLVLAFGSPLGLQNSVSVGVISAVARQLEPEANMIYLQTDAVINPGNSGGPLVDTEGRIVGINTLILSQSGGSEGIGFAAPSNIVRTIYQELRNHGTVHRGRLSIEVQTITPILAAGLNLPQEWGVLVSDVDPTGPAHRDGLRVGDMILRLDGKLMENARQLEVNVYSRHEGEVVTLEILRNFQQMTLRTTVVQPQDNLSRMAAMVNPRDNLIPRLGILALDIRDEVTQLVPTPRKLGGVLVAGRAADAPYLDAGLLPGDVIHQVNGRDVENLSSLRQQLDGLRPGEAVVIQVQRQGKLLYVPFQID